MSAVARQIVGAGAWQRRRWGERGWLKRCRTLYDLIGGHVCFVSWWAPGRVFYQLATMVVDVYS